jgi:hypothetical protein
MAKIRESRRKAELRKIGQSEGKKYQQNLLTPSEKEALREICSKDFTPPPRFGRNY